MKTPMVKEPTPEQWEDLANAIIIRAAFDYREARVKLKENPKSKSAKEELEQIEHFFHSAWYRQLTRVDGAYILRRLKNEPIGWSPVSNRMPTKRGAKS